MKYRISCLLALGAALAFLPTPGAAQHYVQGFAGFLKNPEDSLLFIDGLWSLTFGNDGAAGPATTVFFTAGPNGEADGLFGTLVPAAGESDGSIE